MEAYGGGEVKLHSIFETIWGKWSALSHDRFNSGERVSVPFEYEAEWTPEPVWALWRREKSLASPRNRTTVPRLPSP
jgi:hypothetical protein